MMACIWATARSRTRSSHLHLGILGQPLVESGPPRNQGGGHLPAVGDRSGRAARGRRSAVPLCQHADFANDSPYQELRNLDASTGGARGGALNTSGKELTLYLQNNWQIKPTLTLNYGLRWDSYLQQLARRRT